MTFANAVNQSTRFNTVEFARKAGQIERSIQRRDGTWATSYQPSTQGASSDLGARFFDSWLRGKPGETPIGLPTTVADLFSGCGGLSIGASEAIRGLGGRAVHVLAADNYAPALAVFGENFPEAQLHDAGIDHLVDGDLGSPPTKIERQLESRFAGLDLVIGGPPCQGNSDLNNHTRRSDPRNLLYLKMVRFAEIVRPEYVLIENVPGVAHDRNSVVTTAMRHLVSLGYAVDTSLINSSSLGASQARRRHILMASRAKGVVSADDAETLFSQSPRTVLDAIGDLDLEPERGAFGTAAQHAAVNRTRIDYLFANEIYELPDAKRPPCHRDKPHSYKGVYGRMYPDRPAPTITSGFGSTGQGRFVHPLHPRTLTPHEAARLQGFPDWFSFGAATKRGELQKLIGNAVPSQVAYAAVASLLR